MFTVIMQHPVIYPNLSVLSGRMAGKYRTTSEKTKIMTQYYEIRLKGYLDNSWEDTLAGLAIIHEDKGETLLTGTLPDQSALHGVLNRLQDLGVSLISVNTPESTGDSGVLLEESKNDEYKND